MNVYEMMNDVYDVHCYIDVK